MDEFIQDSVVKGTLELPVSGAEIASAAYRVFNESHVDVVASTPVVIGGTDTQTIITVPALVNGLSGAARGFRTIELALVLTSGERKFVTYSYILKGTESWEVPSQTFQTYEQAVLTALDLTNIPGWNMADEQLRKAALKEAHSRIDSLSFDMLEATEFPDFPALEPGFQGRVSNLELADFDDLPDSFLGALKIAQVLEADQILVTTDPTERRNQGLLSMTVGESSAMFRSGKPVRTPVCKRAFDYLSRFVRAGNFIGRS